MINRIGRRRVVVGLGQAATFGSVAAALPHIALAGQAPAPAPQKVCLSMLYPSGDGLSFDANAFRDRHVKVLRDAYGPSVERVELRVAPPPPPPPVVAEGETPPPAPPQLPILASVSMWLANISEFVRRAPEAARVVSADMASITRSAPMVQFDVVEGTAGDAATSVIGGSTVLSSFFFAKEGGTWDAAYFGKTYLPKLMEAYGPAAIQRAEVSRGEIAQGGGKPLIAGTIHLYVRDANAYDAAVSSGNEALMMLNTEWQQNTTLAPMTMVMTVHATG